LSFLVVKRGGMNRMGWLLLLGILFVSACAPSAVFRKYRVVESPETVRAMERFKEAERLAAAEVYGEAIAIYEGYLKAYPKGALADKALMRSGLVSMAAGRYDRARNSFQRLLLQFPNSPFSDDARYNMILSYYTEGDFDSAVEYGELTLKRARTQDHELRIHNLLGYVFSAGGEFLKAFESYMKAYEQSSKEAQPEILSKIKEVISYLKEKDLVPLLEQYGERVPGGYLRLQLAREYAAEDLIEAAMATLYELMDQFPNHEETATVEAMLEELTSRSRVDPYLIGCILPLSGRYALFGEKALSGIELALDEFNATLGVQPVRLVIRDSQGEPGAAVAALEELVFEEGVIGVVGPMVTAEAVANRAQALQVPILAMTQKPNITMIGDYIFRNFLTSSLQVKALVEYTVQDLGIQRFAIFYPNEPYGVSFMNRFWDELSRHGAEVVGIESYATDQTDFRDSIKKLVGLYYPRLEDRPEEEFSKETEIWNKLLGAEDYETGRSVSEQFEDQTPPEFPQDEGLQEGEDELEPIVDFEAIFIPDSYEKIGLIAPQLMYHDVSDVLLLGTNLWHSEKLLNIAKIYVEGAIVPDGFFAGSPSVQVMEFVENFRSLFGRMPGFLEAQAYDVARIIFEAANDPDVRSRLTLMTSMKRLYGFHGVTGVVTFDETGDAEKDLYLLAIEGGRFVQIKP